MQRSIQNMCLEWYKPIKTQYDWIQIITQMNKMSPLITFTLWVGRFNLERKISVKEQRRGSLSRFVLPDVLRAFPCTSVSVELVNHTIDAQPERTSSCCTPASCHFHWSGWKGNDGTEHLALNRILVTNESHLYPASTVRPTPESRVFSRETQPPSA